MYNYLYNVVVIYTDHNNNAGINVKTEGGGGGVWEKVQHLNFLGQIPDPWDWKIVQI